MTAHPPVLLVEDDGVHVHLVRRFLAKGGLVNPIHAIGDGAHALAYLHGTGEYADRSRYPLPAVVITDLNLAGTGGLEVVRAIRDGGSLESIPVIVMSGSTKDEDIASAHRLGAQAYLVKPVAFEALLDVIRRLGLPWALQRQGEGGNDER